MSEELVSEEVDFIIGEMLEEGLSPDECYDLLTNAEFLEFMAELEEQDFAAGLSKWKQKSADQAHASSKMHTLGKSSKSGAEIAANARVTSGMSSKNSVLANNKAHSAMHHLGKAAAQELANRKLKSLSGKQGKKPDRMGHIMARSQSEIKMSDLGAHKRPTYEAVTEGKKPIQAGLDKHGHHEVRAKFLAGKMKSYDDKKKKACKDGKRDAKMESVEYKPFMYHALKEGKLSWGTVSDILGEAALKTIMKAPAEEREELLVEVFSDEAAFRKLLGHCAW